MSQPLIRGLLVAALLGLGTAAQAVELAELERNIDDPAVYTALGVPRTEATRKILALRNRLTRPNLYHWDARAVDAVAFREKIAAIGVNVARADAEIRQLDATIATTRRQIQGVIAAAGGFDKVPPEELGLIANAQASITRAAQLRAQVAAEVAKWKEQRDAAAAELAAWTQLALDAATRVRSGPDFERLSRNVSEIYSEIHWVVRTHLNGAREGSGAGACDLSMLRQWAALDPTKLSADLPEKLHMRPDGSFPDQNLAQAFTNPEGVWMMLTLLRSHQKQHGITEAEPETAIKMLATALHVAIRSQADSTIADAARRADLLRRSEQQAQQILRQRRATIADVLEMYRLLMEADPVTLDPDRHMAPPGSPYARRGQG